MIFRLFGLLFLALTTKSAFSQPLPDRHPLAGRALDAEGKPLAGATISLRRQDKDGSYAFWGAATATDERGEFRFPHAETGRYFLDATRAGFAPLLNQSLHWNRAAAPLQLKLERLLTLQLRISRPDGTPAAKTPFWLRLEPLNAPPTTRRAQSDDLGRVRFEALLPATYALFLAGDNGFFRQNELILRADAMLDVALQQGGLLRVAVRQNGPPMRGLGGALLSLVPQNATDSLTDPALLAAQGERLSLISRDGDGSIELSGVAPGRYLAHLSLSGYRIEPQPVTVEAGQSVDLSWNLPAQPAAFLTLQLRSPQSVAGEMALRFLPLKADGTLAGEPVFNGEGAASDVSRERRAVVDESGKITIFPLRAGRYRVFVAPRVSGFDLEKGPAEAASVDVTVAPQGAAAQVTLKNSP